MRNLTKVLALVLAFAMMVSGAAFAVSYTDVEAGANYEEAVDVLSDLGLVLGYTDGTFGAEKTLTRAEAAALVVRLMGLEDAAIAAAGSDTGFTDVPSDHWASGYIYIAAQKGVVAGMGDGTFEPETTLEYAQIVKMIVVALGYAPQAAEAGEWPGNFISTATNIALTKGIPGKATDAASRGLTARLLYAALTIPKMEKNGVGVNAVFEPVDKMILDELSIYKLVGSVVAVDAVNGKATLDVEKQGLIINKKYKETADEDYVTYDAPASIEAGKLIAELQELKNVPAYIYVQEDDGDYTIVSIVARKNVSTVTFTSEDIDEYDEPKLYVYTNAEQTKTTSYKLADEIAVYVNGELNDDDMDVEAFAEMIEEGAYLIDLMDAAESDDVYETAKLTEFEYMVVDEIKVSKQGVYSFKGETLAIADDMDDFEIDTENDETAIIIIKDNEVVDVDAIEEGDVLNIVKTGSAPMDGDELIEGTIYVTSEKVEGTVRYVDNDDDIPVVTMTDGTSYKTIAADVAAVDSQTEATFYLNISGKIIYMDNEASKSSYDYAFATNLILSGKSGQMKTGTIRVLTTEGEWKTLDLKSTFTLNDESFKITDIDVEEFAEEAAFVANADDEREPEFAILTMIAYKLDTTGAVKEIIVITETDEPEENKFAYDKTFKTDDEESTFGSYYVDETTVVYNINEDADMDCTFDEKDINVTDIAILKDDQDYTANLYDIDDKTDLVSILLGSFIADVDFESPLFLVSKVLEENIDDKDVVVLIGFEDGKEVTYYVSQDDESEVVAVDDEADPVAAEDENIEDIFTAEGYAHGDIMIVNADSKGIIAKAVVMGSVYDFVADEDGEEFNYANLDLAGPAIDGEDEGFVVAGLVAERNSAKTKVWLDTDDTILGVEDEDAYIAELKETEGTEFGIKGTKVTVFDATAKKANRISDGSVSDIEKGTIVVGRCDEDFNLVEVIVIITEATDEF